MLKLSDSFRRLLFVTLIVLFCFNGQQFAYASNLVLDKNKLEATVEISSATGSSAPTNTFDLKFDVGDASDYDETKTFKLAVGSACNLDFTIKKDDDNDEKTFKIIGIPISELASLKITNKKITAYSSKKGQPSLTLCAPQDSNNGGGGSVVFEKPVNDPGKSTIKLTLSDVEDLPDDFKLTSNAKIYVPPTLSPPSSSNGNGSEDGSKTEEGLNSLTIGFIVFMVFIGLGLTATIIVAIVCCIKHCKKKDDEEESETITRDRKFQSRGIPKIGTYY